MYIRPNNVPPLLPVRFPKHCMPAQIQHRSVMPLFVHDSVLSIYYSHGTYSLMKYSSVLMCQLI